MNLVAALGGSVNRQRCTAESAEWRRPGQNRFDVAYPLVPSTIQLRTLMASFNSLASGAKAPRLVSGEATGNRRLELADFHAKKATQQGHEQLWVRSLRLSCCA